MSRTQTLVQLSEALLSALDQRAAKQGVSRSQLIRDAVAVYLRADLDAEISERIIAGYERVPQATPDEWGEVEGWAEQSAEWVHRRLDAEERAGGDEPW